MTVNAIDDSILAPPAAPASRGSLGQQDFLTLMIAQFRNQDPFKPMESGDFLGQLAQFGTVNGIEQLNGAFAGLQESLQSDQMLKAASLVGRSVLAVADEGYLAEGGVLAGAVELPTSATSVQVEITNASGELVRRLDLGAQQAGLVRFEWDGRDAKHDAVQPGHYRVTARVLRGSQVESIDTLLEARIDSVNLGRYGEPMTLNVPGGGFLTVSQVRRIY
jgi:flagellar basal-body rod modification protein FlgD